MDAASFHLMNPGSSMIKSNFKRLVRAGVRRALVPAASAVCLMAATSAQAVVVDEVGDAGQTLPSAQATFGLGPLLNIRGSLSSSTDADLFLIRITDFSTFSATTISTGGPDTDTQLFLFTAQGAAVYGNDDASGLSFLSSLPATHPSGPLAPGLYYIGVSSTGYEPVNSNGQLLFDFGSFTTDIRTPNASATPTALAGFDGSPPFPDGGTYDIQFTGATVSAVPEPATGLMFLAGGLLAAARVKRRRAAAPVTAG